MDFSVSDWAISLVKNQDLIHNFGRCTINHQPYKLFWKNPVLKRFQDVDKCRVPSADSLMWIVKLNVNCFLA